MKKTLAILAAVVVVAGLARIAAQTQPAPPLETTVTGEVIDTGCGAGKGHEECATQCVRDGQAAAIKAKDGVYTITGPYAANKNAKLVEFVAKDVQAKGVVTKDKDGKLTINVSSIALAK